MLRNTFSFPQGVRKHFLLPARGAQTFSDSRRGNAGGTGPSWIPVPTKLFQDGGRVV